MSDGPSDEAVRDALREVLDPEVGMNIIDLGLVYGIDVDATRISVQLTMTSPACPLGETIVANAERAIRQALPGVRDVAVQLVWEPSWHAGMMSEQAGKYFGWQ